MTSKSYNIIQSRVKVKNITIDVPTVSNCTKNKINEIYLEGNDKQKVQKSTFDATKVAMSLFVD